MEVSGIKGQVSLHTSETSVYRFADGSDSDTHIKYLRYRSEIEACDVTTDFIVLSRRAAEKVNSLSNDKEKFQFIGSLRVVAVETESGYMLAAQMPDSNPVEATWTF